MGVATQVKPDQRLSLLREACQRNVAVELHFNDRDGVLVTARARMLDLQGEQILVDRPLSNSKGVVFKQGQRVTFHFPIGGVRYAFRTHVVRCQCLVRLNSRERVVGLGVALPSQVEERQRRADFRLSLAGDATALAGVHRGVPDNGGSATVDAQRLSARMLNISAGGIGLLIDAGETRKWRQRDIFFVSFELPEVEVVFCTMAELRHCRRIHDGLSTVTGFRFLPWPVVSMKSYVQRIQRFIATRQRRRVRRGR